MVYTRNRFTLGAAVAAILLLSTSFAIGATDSDTSTMDVTVNSKTIIDVTPNQAVFSGDPGTVTSPWTNFTLENVGSENISDVYASVTQPSSNPFGTGFARNYDAGNLIGINTSSESNPYYADRKEFNDTMPDYVTLASGCTETNASGRIRLDNEEFFWCATQGAANEYNGTLYFSDSPHNETHLGDVDLSGNSQPLTSRTGYDYALADISLASDEGSRAYCVAVDHLGGHLRIVKWNTNLDSDSTCTNDQALSTGSPALKPGELEKLDIVARIPFGVAEGSLSQGTLTITAST